MKGALMALLAAVGLIAGWSQFAWSDPIDSSGRKYHGGRPHYSDRYFDRRDRYWRERYRERRRFSRSHRWHDDYRFRRRHRYDAPPRYARRHHYDRHPRHLRRYHDVPRYSRVPHYDGPRYSRAPYVGPPVYYSRPASYGPPAMRVLINPDAELPGAYGWRDQYQPVGPLVTPRAIEQFFTRSQGRAN